MTDMIQRYVAAALARIPENRRGEVGLEIRGAIDEMVEPRIAAGEPEDQAVRAALTELGDPARLAASYTQQERYLIGPGWFPIYIDVLKRVLVVTVPLLALVSLLLNLGNSENSLGSAIIDAIGTIYDVGIQVVLWTTIAFAILERAGGPELLRGSVREWSVDDLPAPAPPRQIGLGETAWTIAMIVVLGALALLPQAGDLGFLARSLPGDAERMPLVNPDLGLGWATGFLGLLAFSVVATIVRYLRGVWTYHLVLLTALESAAWIAFTVALAANRAIINPELARELDPSNGAWWTAGGEANRIIAAIMIAIAGWELVEAWQGYRRRQHTGDSGYTAIYSSNPGA